MGGFAGRVAHAVDGEFHVFRGHRLTVMEGHVLTQLKAPHGRRYRFPGLRHIALEVHVFVELQEGVEQAPDDIGLRDERGHGGVESVDDAVAGDRCAQHRALRRPCLGPAHGDGGKSADRGALEQPAAADQSC